jgi:hypothetical protein
LTRVIHRGRRIEARRESYIFAPLTKRPGDFRIGIQFHSEGLLCPL